MNNTKEYNEILYIFKKLIEKDEIKITEDSFTIQNLKYILTTNDVFKNEILSLKEKLKSQSEKNKNIFNLITQINRKKTFDIKIILHSLNGSFSFFYNEPKYISEFNEILYEKIVADINKKKSEYQIISNSKSSNYYEDLFNAKCEFYNNQNFANITPDFILNLIYTIKNPNISTSHILEKKNSQFFFNFRLNYFNLKNLKETYSQIIFNWNNSTEEQINSKKRNEMLIKLIQTSKNIQLLEICKDGIPNSLRKNIYNVLLNIDNIQGNESIVNNNDLIYIFDYYILRDVHRITSSENYFLFEENLIKLLSILIRDVELMSQIQGTRPILAFKQSNTNDNNLIPFPPSGIFPFQGLAFQLAPFSYMSPNLNDYYIVAKNFYAKYLSFISSYSSNKNSILVLICSFNNIFNECETFSKIRQHFLSIKYDVNSIAIYWFMTSFANIISPENVLKIYDLVIITNSLSIYILVALSFLYYKKNDLLEIYTIDEIKKSFEEITFDQIDIIELMGDFLSNC